MIRLTALLAPLALTACMEVPGDMSMTTRTEPAGFGLPVAQEACEATAQRQIAGNLRNPLTARYTFGDCTPGTLGAMPLAGLPRQQGYVINVSVRAQNGYGQYTNPTAYRLLLRDGEVIRQTVYDRRRGRMVTF